MGEAEYDDTIDAKLTTDPGSNGKRRRVTSLFCPSRKIYVLRSKNGFYKYDSRQFKVGFNRAARIMEQLYDAGVVGQEESNKPRKVIMSIEAFEQMVNGGQ